MRDITSISKKISAVYKLQRLFDSSKSYHGTEFSSINKDNTISEKQKHEYNDLIRQKLMRKSWSQGSLTMASKTRCSKRQERWTTTSVYFSSYSEKK